MSGDDYQLPASDAVGHKPRMQWWRMFWALLRLGWHLIWPLLVGNPQRAAAATWALKWECETLHRILAGQGADVALARPEDSLDR